MSDDAVVVIGGSSGIGLAVARRCLADGHRVVIAGRSADRLAAAQAELGRPERLAAVRADIAIRADLEVLFGTAGPVAHVVVTAADLPYGPVGMLTEDSMLRAIRSKILGPLLVAQVAAPLLGESGSITYTSGIAAHRPMPGGTLTAAVNGALESMVRGLALELAPIRVNAVSPGWVDTPTWERLVPAPEARHARLADMAARLPGKRNGRAEDVANAIAFLVNDKFVTGTVLHAEGGQVLV
ncbi:MAG TPA: SDR family oxidoreductase [Streptosporangiaceae bacterium]|nr:SDR family oxidoreductase [Streptosporangiaceae bacterium]